MNQLKRFLRKKMNLTIRRRRTAWRRLLCVETLEDRRLLAFDPSSLDEHPEAVPLYQLGSQPQIVFLDFDGAENVTYDGPIVQKNLVIPSFNAASVGLGGAEPRIINSVIDTLNIQFNDTGIRFTQNRPSSDAYSTIYVGGTDSSFSQYGSFNGLAEKIDIANSDRSDNAFVFSAKLGFLGMSSDRFASEVINVISHETLHLLGYSHALEQSPHVSPLQAVAFGSDIFYHGEPTHQQATADAFPFVRENILAAIQEGNEESDKTNNDLLACYTPAVDSNIDGLGLLDGPQFDPANHFDGSYFNESAARINTFLERTVEIIAASPTGLNQNNALEASRCFGRAVHIAQDFYSHSNWVELHAARDNSGNRLIPENALIDMGLSHWNSLFPYSNHSGALIVQGETLPPWIISVTRQSENAVVWVTKSDGQIFPGIISGSLNPIVYPQTEPDGDDTPGNAMTGTVAMRHGGKALGLNVGNTDFPDVLSKDDDTYAGFQQAFDFAVDQTRHEMKRLFSLVHERLGTVKPLLDAWIGEFSGQIGDFRGQTGDIIPVDLGRILHDGAQFAFTGQARILSPIEDGTFLSKTLKATFNVERRDWKLYYLSPDGIEQVVGYVVQSDKIDKAPFKTFGKFYFAPGTANNLVHDQSALDHGFQGRISLQLSVDGVETYDVIIKVLPGVSTNSAAAEPAFVSDYSLNALRLQQRLNYLGYRDTTDDFTRSTIAFTNGTPAPDTITDSGNGFVLAGFQPGMKITVRGSASGQNDGTFTIATVTPGVLTLIGTDSLTTQPVQPAGSSVSLTLHKPLAVDGIIGPRTQSAIRALKQSIYPATRTSSTIGFVNSNPDKITDIENGLVTAGFKPGMKIHVSGSASGANAKTFTIANVTAGEITLISTDSVTAQGPGTSITLEDAERISDKLTNLSVLHLNGSGGTLSAEERQSSAQGLRAAGQRIGLGNLALLKQPLPLVGTTVAETKSIPTTPKDEISLASALSIDTELQDSLFNPLADYIQSTESPDQVGAQEYLTGRGVTGVSLTSFVPSIGTGGQQVARNSFRIGFTRTVSDTSRTLRLGENASVAGLATNLQIPITLTTTLTGDLEFGVDLTKSVLDEAFYLKIHSLTANAGASLPPASLTDLDILGRFLKLDVSSGNLNLNAGVSVASAEFTLGSLIRSPLSSLVSVTAPTASAFVGFTASAELFGKTYTVSINFSDGDVFDNTPIDLSIENFVDSIDASIIDSSEGLKRLLTIGSSSFKEALTQFGTAIDNLRGTSLFDVSLGLAKSLDVGNVLKLKEAWDAVITNNFGGNNPVQDLASLLDRLGASSDGNYNAATGQLTIDLDMSRALLKQSGVVGFDTDLGPIGSFSSASLAEIQADATLKFTLGIDLNGALGSGFDLSDSTLLTTLNGPDGLTDVTYFDEENIQRTRWDIADRPGTLDGVRITLSDGTSFDVELDNLTTVDQVLTAINGAAAAPTALGARYAQLYTGGSAFASLDVTRKSFKFLDKTRGEAGSFTIIALNNSVIGMAGVGLGIFGTSSSANADGYHEILGAPLHNDGLAQRLYLVSTPANLPTIGGSVVVTASDIDASLKVLIAEAKVVNGTGTARASLMLTLDGMAADDGKITLSELLQSIDTPALLVVAAESSASLNVILPVTASAPWLAANQVASGNVVVSWPNFPSIETLEVTHD
ncbi:MAG: HET-C-related protein, partial [Pirellula sp.]